MKAGHAGAWLAAAVLIAPGCGAPPGGGGASDAAIDAAPEPADAATDGAPLPDLTIEVQRAVIDLAIERRTFAADACELDPTEDCIGAPGERTLLRFGVEVPNIGAADLTLGTADEDNEHFVWSECHGHYHLEGFADYRLLGDDSAAGHKQAFCLVDTHKYLADDPTVADDALYSCVYQGIQRGWADVYQARLPCQFIDVTDLPPGDYTLELAVNEAGALAEADYTNNTATVPVTLGDPDLETPTEPCPAGLDERATDGGHRECGWDLAGTWDCVPNQLVSLGCAEACDGQGSCTGDPMLRVCDAARADGNCSYAAAAGLSDDACNSACPRVVDLVCPDSGTLAAYVAPHRLGQDFTCELELR